MGRSSSGKHIAVLLGATKLDHLSTHCISCEQREERESRERGREERREREVTPVMPGSQLGPPFSIRKSLHTVQ